MSETNRREYQMTPKYFEELVEASIARVMFLSGGEPMFGDSRERAHEVWRRMGAEFGFDWETAEPSKKGPMYFTAVPLPVQPKARIEITDALIDAMDKFGADFADGKIGGREDYFAALDRIFAAGLRNYESPAQPANQFPPEQTDSAIKRLRNLVDGVVDVGCTTSKYYAATFDRFFNKPSHFKLQDIDHLLSVVDIQRSALWRLARPEAMVIASDDDERVQAAREFSARLEYARSAYGGNTSDHTSSSAERDELRPAIKSAIHALTAAKTMNDVMALLRLAETKEEATALRAKYVSTIGDPRAEEIADHNIGYMTGYYGREEAKRLLDLYGVSHPIFGRSHVDGTLTPERALQMGMEMGREAKAKRES